MEKDEHHVYDPPSEEMLERLRQRPRGVPSVIPPTGDPIPIDEPS